MPRLLTAYAVAMPHHVFVDVLISYGSLRIINPHIVQSLIQAEITHHCGDNGVGYQFASLFHITGIDIHNFVTVHHCAGFVYGKAPIRVTVIGKAHVHAVLHHVLLESFNVGRSSIVVDIYTVGAVVQNIDIRSQRPKHTGSNGPGTAISTVQGHFFALKGVYRQRDQISNIPIAAGAVIHHRAYAVPCGLGQLPYRAAIHL